MSLAGSRSCRFRIARSIACSPSSCWNTRREPGASLQSFQRVLEAGRHGASRCPAHVGRASDALRLLPFYVERHSVSAGAAGFRIRTGSSRSAVFSGSWPAADGRARRSPRRAGAGCSFRSWRPFSVCSCRSAVIIWILWIRTGRTRWASSAKVGSSNNDLTSESFEIASASPPVTSGTKPCSARRTDRDHARKHREVQSVLPDVPAPHLHVRQREHGPRSVQEDRRGLQGLRRVHLALRHRRTDDPSEAFSR